jgi:hypothetical protein
MGQSLSVSTSSRLRDPHVDPVRPHHDLDGWHAAQRQSIVVPQREPRADGSKETSAERPRSEQRPPLGGRSEFRRPDGTANPTGAAPVTHHTGRLIEVHPGPAAHRRHHADPDLVRERLDPTPILAALLPRLITTAA